MSPFFSQVVSFDGASGSVAFVGSSGTVAFVGTTSSVAFSGWVAFVSAAGSVAFAGGSGSVEFCKSEAMSEPQSYIKTSVVLRSSRVLRDYVTSKPKSPSSV